MLSLRSAIAWGTCVLGLAGSVASAQEPVMTMVPVGSTTITQGQTVTFEIYAQDVYDPSDPGPDLLQAYQVTLEIVPDPGATGSLGLDEPPDDNIFVDITRPDWVFASFTGTIFDVTNIEDLSLGALGFSAAFPQVTTPRYLGTYVFAPSPGTVGDFQVRFKPMPDPNTLPNQLVNQNGFQISFTVSPADGITVRVVDVALNDACASAPAISDGVTSFSTENATTDGPAHPGSGCDQSGSSTVSNDIWYDYTASCSGVLTISTCNSADYDSRVAVYDGCACPFTDADLIACNDNAVSCGLTTKVSAEGVVENDCYKIRVGGTNGATGTGSLAITCIGNDVCADAQPLSVGSSVQGSTQGTALNDGLLLDCGAGVVDSPGVWYSVVGTGERLEASIPSASYNTRLTVYEGNCSTLTCAGDAVDNPGGTQESVSWCTGTGVVYRILVHGSGGANGTFTLNVADASCDDANACTDDPCSNGVCSHNPNYDDTRLCCAPPTRDLTVIDDSNPCTFDNCNPATGVVTHPPVPDGLNVACDDSVVCTLDECTSGQCTNSDINSMPCQNDFECPDETICGDGSGGTQPGLCFCDSGPLLELVPGPGALPVEGCYAIGEFVNVRVEMGLADEPIVGAQFFLEYDALTLDFLGIEPGVTVDPSSPFALEFMERVDEGLGTIDYMVGLDFGVPGGTIGPETVAVITFQALAECDAYVSYRDSGPGGQLNLLTALGGGQVDPILIDSPQLELDLNPPTLTSCPGNIFALPDPGGFTAVATWSVPTAVDNCDPGPVMVICSPSSGSVFPAGTTTVFCTAVDSCGLTDASCTFDVTVEPPVLSVDVELSATVAPGPFERCLTFDLWDCDGPPSAQHASVEQTFTFTGGLASGVNVSIPGGAWECLTVRDKLHTLRSTAPDLFTADGALYTASVTGPRSQGGHWLVGGNLNDDEFIDIRDFGVLFPMHLSLSNPDTPCGTPAPNANINGDGLVDLMDLVIFVGNSLKGAEPNCCSVGTVAASGPIQSITVEELRQLGLEHMIAADVNRDGVLDMDDVATVLQGNSSEPKDRDVLRSAADDKARRRRHSGR